MRMQHYNRRRFLAFRLFAVLTMITASAMGLNASVWAGQPSLKKGAVKGMQIKGLKGTSLYTDLSCRNPGSAQDISKTPYIKNTTGKIIKAGARINWYSSDGDKGTITLQKMLGPNVEIQGTGKAAKSNYSCTAKTLTSELQPFKMKNGAFDVPKLESMLTVPGNNLPKPPAGVLQAGSILYLKGMHFGTQPGRILIYFGNSPVQLENIVWENATRIHGTVPMSVNGRPNQKVSIRVERADHKRSNARQINFRGREEMVLPGHRPKVKVLHCGDDGSTNTCNELGGGYWSSGNTLDDFALCGRHTNDNAFESKSGSDHYEISLKNGWTFKSFHWKRRNSSSDEYLDGPTPSLPAGQSHWDPIFNWKVSIAGPFVREYVEYKVKVIVEGPVGTLPW